MYYLNTIQLNILLWPQIITMEKIEHISKKKDCYTTWVIANVILL